MEKNTRGIGDNSVQDDTFQSLAEATSEISKKLWSVLKLIHAARDTHTASHGDNYYFKYEVSDRESERANVLRIMPKEGVERRPNPYEKKEFAGATTNTLADAAEETINLVTELGNLGKKFGKKDEANNEQ